MGARDKPLYLTWSWKNLQMSHSRELSNITTMSSMYLLLHNWAFLFFSSAFFSRRILKIPKTAIVTSPICQALRSARSLRHFLLFFFPYQWTFHFFAGAVSFKPMPTYWKWRPIKENVFSSCFEFFKDSFSPLHSITPCLPWTALVGEMNALSIL